ncbi:protein NEDD1-like [Photinus pyralis]|uniref:protein NEDD1-like n=1 Tax=Photinus pyralis TaxID=7054 RepID=UPI0012673AC2|nr:protein NEDD1-like [Photinus pyralis]
MLLASCGTDIKFHKWPSGHYHSSFQFPESGSYKPSLSWCCEGELLATTVPSMGCPLIMHVGKTIQTYMVIEMDEIQALSFSRTVQNYITLGNGKGKIALYDLQQQAVLQQLHPLPSAVMFLEYGAMDSCLAAGCTNGQIYLYNSNYTISSTYYVPDSNNLTAMAYHRKQANLLAAAGSDGIVVVWDSITGNAEIVDKSHINSITDLAFSLGDDMVTVGLDHKLNGYDLRTKSVIFSCISDTELTSVGFFPTGDQIAAASSDGKLFCYDRRKITYPFNTIVTHHPKKVSRIAFQTQSDLMDDSSGAGSVTTVYYNGPSKRDDHSPIIGDVIRPLKKGDSCLFAEQYSGTISQTPASGDCGPVMCDSHDSCNVQPELRFPNTNVPVNVNRQSGCTNLHQENPENIRLLGTSFKRNMVSSWVKQIQKSSSQGNIDHANDVAQMKNELVDFTADTFDRLNDFINKQFFKLRMAVSKGFIQMEHKMNAKWNEFNLTDLQFLDEDDIDRTESSFNFEDENGEEELEDRNGAELKSRIPVLSLPMK